MADGGYIKFYRKMREHWIWEEPLYLKWWLDILLMVNHKPSKIFVNNEVRIIDVGERHTSETKLAERWFVNRKTVDKFLKLLEKDGMISLKKNRNSGTTLKVLNYKAYQAFFDGSEDNELDKSADKTMDIFSAYSPHKQEPKELEEPKESKSDLDMTKVISPADYRQRYTGDQLKIIDTFFDILKHTRKSARLADSVILKTYSDWERHPVQKVLYALHKYIHTPTLHDKKESYVLQIINNATASEIEKYKQIVSKKPKKNEVSANGADKFNDPYANIPTMRL